MITRPMQSHLANRHRPRRPGHASERAAREVEVGFGIREATPLRRERDLLPPAGAERVRAHVLHRDRNSCAGDGAPGRTWPLKHAPSRAEHVAVLHVRLRQLYVCDARPRVAARDTQRAVVRSERCTREGVVLIARGRATIGLNAILVAVEQDRGNAVPVRRSRDR